MEADKIIRAKEYLKTNPEARELIKEGTKLLGYKEEDEFINDFLECIFPRFTGKTLTPRLDYIMKAVPHLESQNIARMEQPVGFFWLILIPLFILLSPILIPASLIYLFGTPRLRCIVESVF